MLKLPSFLPPSLPPPRCSTISHFGDTQVAKGAATDGNARTRDADDDDGLVRRGTRCQEYSHSSGFGPNSSAVVARESTQFPFFWPRFNQSTTHTSSVVGGIISRGQHVSRSNVKRALRFSVLALRTVTETLGSSREKAAGEKLAKPRIRDRCVRSTPVVLSGSDLAKPRAENDILASFFLFLI